MYTLDWKKEQQKDSEKRLIMNIETKINLKDPEINSESLIFKNLKIINKYRKKFQNTFLWVETSLLDW